MEKFNDKIYYSKATLAPLKASACFIIGSEKNVLIDAGTTLEDAKKIKDFIENKLNKKIDFIILTHHHYDHTAGISLFNVPIYMHSKTLAYLKLNVTADIHIFDHDFTFDLKDETIFLSFIHTSHTDDHILIYLMNEKILFLGDSLQSKLMNGKFYFNQEKTQKLYDQVMSFDFSYAHTGHQGIMSRNEIIHYFDLMRRASDLIDIKQSLENHYEKYETTYEVKVKGLAKYFIDGFYNESVIND